MQEESPSVARHIDDGLALKIARCQGGLMPEACKHTMLSLSKNGVDDVLACHCTVLAPLYIAADDDATMVRTRFTFCLS